MIGTRSRHDVLERRTRRAVPYLYTEQEIAALIAATYRLRGHLRPSTYRTLIGLLAVTGMRVGEAIRLDRGDLDPGNRLLTVRESKFGICRNRHMLNYVARRTMLRWAGEPCVWAGDEPLGST